LERLWQFQLYAKFSRHAFSMEMVDFLGFVITPEGVKMEKIA
jgi:hypothetical protein